MKKILALLLAMLLVLSVFASCGTNDGEETEDTEKKTEATGDSEKETEKETEKESEKESDGGSDAETPACQHPDADKSYTSVDATNHKVTCKCGATVAATEAHSYDNDADMKCNKCNYDRTPAAPACTHPEADKTYTKIDATNHKVTCKCGATVAATEAHTFASETTAKCSKCDYTRCVNHIDANSDFVCDTADCNVVVEPAAGELTLAQAKALGALMGSKPTTNKYILSGTITKVEGADYYGNITITDGTDEILIWGTYDVTGETRYGEMTEKPAKGDTMVVSGVLTSYNGVGQMKDGWITSYQLHTHAFVEGTCTACGASETPCLHENSATVISATKHYVNCECEVKQIADHDFGTDTVCDACGFDSSYTYAAPVEGTAYYLGMIQGAKNLNDVYYLTGAMATGNSSNYMATTTDTTAAAKVYVEATTGGYYLYCYVDTVKTYINMVVSGTYVNGKYETEAKTVYTFDNVTNTFVSSVTVGEDTNDYRFGTRNDKTYTTVGPVKVENNAFFCQLYVAEAAPVCEHTERTYVNNGTDHSWTCTCGDGVANEAHAAEGICACSTACEAAGHDHKTCTNTGNAETHTWECTCGLSGTEDHDFDGMICKDCGFDKTPTGTCAHEEYDYVNNNDGTHTATCKNVACDNETGRTFTKAHNYVNGVCDKCRAECAHSKDYINNGADHSWTCEFCDVSAENEAHATEGPCACSTACEEAEHNHKNYTNNGAVHSWTCTCGVSAENEEHFFDGGTCACEATCAHESKSYTANGANHKWTCDAENCTATGSESHADVTGDDYKCDKCEAVVEPDNTNPLTIEEALKLGNLYAKNNYTTKEYAVTGVITKVEISNGYGNVTITDGKGNELLIYGLYGDDACTIKYPNMDPKPIAGDTITAIGIIGKFTNAQMKNGWASDIQHDHDYTDNKCACGAYSDDDAGKAQEALDKFISAIKTSGTEAFDIEFPNDGYTWKVNGEAVVDGKYTVSETAELAISVTVGEATKTANVTITIQAAPQGEKTVTLVATSLGLENAQAWPETTLDEITISANKGQGSTEPAFYTTGNALRLYGKNVMTIKAEEGYVISSVTITTVTSSSNKLNNESASAGDKSANEAGTVTTFSNIGANEWTLTNGNSSGHYRITEITVV